MEQRFRHASSVSFQALMMKSNGQVFQPAKYNSWTCGNNNVKFQEQVENTFDNTIIMGNGIHTHRWTNNEKFFQWE